MKGNRPRRLKPIKLSLHNKLHIGTAIKFMQISLTVNFFVTALTFVIIHPVAVADPKKG